VTSAAFSTLPPQNVSAMQMWNAIRLAALDFSPGPPPPETLEPPTNFAFAYTDTGTGINIEFTWGPPATGLTPESYYLQFNSYTIGGSTYYVSGFSQTISDVYSDAWGATLQSYLTGYEPSTPALLDGNTPAAPYP
jgi:hypothetical protein